MGKLHIQDRPLKSIHAEIAADPVVVVAPVRTMDPDMPRAGVQLLVAGNERSALAAGSEVLGRVEAESPAIAQKSDGGSPVARPDRLRAVLDHEQPVPAGNRHDL